jgi:hypothetical protein
MRCHKYRSHTLRATIMIALIGLTGVRKIEARVVHHRTEGMRMITSILFNGVHCEHAWNRYLYVFL